MAKHAALGASSAKRWMSCPGSPRLIKECGIVDPPSIHAMKGTAVHSVIEAVLDGKMGEAEDALGRVFDNYEVTVDMVASAQVMIDYVRGRMAEMPNATLLLEQRVDLGEYAPPGEKLFGRTDSAMVDTDSGLLEIADFKDGAGVVVEVEGNPQLRYYALGSWLALGPDARDTITTIRSTVVQPNAYHSDGPIRSETIAVLDLLGWAEDLRLAALETTRPDAKLRAGGHCRWCAARSVCPERNNVKVLDAISDFVPDLTPGPLSPTVIEQVALLSPDQVAGFLASAKKIHAIIKDGEEYLKREILAGRPVAGFKLVEGPGKRVFLSSVSDAHLAELLSVGEDEVDDTLDLLGMDRGNIRVPDVLRLLDIDENIYWEPRKAVSPSGLEKRIGRKHPHYKKLSLLSERRSGRPLLVPETDGRPAIEDVGSFVGFDGTIEGEFMVDD